ncbi:unnamed protein product [Rotaria sp. Silwood1]|nr:unnamed protein product [Rotaria sp. Silwood1]
MVEIQTNRSIDISNTINTAIMNWSPDGKNQFNELYKQLLNDDKDKFEAELAIKQLLVSLCKSCLQGSQSVETVIRIFGELQEIVSCSSIIGDLLADIFATLDVELFPNDDTITKDTYKQRFFQLINNSEHIVSTTLLMERLEIETLEYLDLIVSREQFSQKYVRIKTRLYYKQQKFNLLREESEGFAKTLTELNQNFSITKLTSEQLYDRLMALIGYFDIDPNRMLDLVIESFEYHLEYTKIYVNLLNLLHFDKITLCQLIGFKFQQYQLQDETADSLYLLAAQLISNNIIELEDLLPHLYPLITDFSDNYIKEIEHVRTSKKSLTSSKDSNTIKTNNQLLHFIQALLYVGDLEHILILFNNLPRWSCTSYREINILLTKIIAYMIDPFYKSNSDLHMCFLQYELNNPLNLNICPRNLNLIKNWNEFRENIYPLLLHLGPYCQDRLLYMQLTQNFHHKFPSIDDLVLGFHLQVDAAFQISRPLFNLNIQAKFDEFRSTASKSLNKNALIQNYIEAVTYVMSPVLDFVKTLHPQRTWEEMTPQFYLTFWSLSMSDLQVPEIAYKRRIEELELEMTQIDERKELTAAKKRKEKEKIHIIIDKLKEELFKQKEHVERVRARLDIEREHWFKNRNKTKAETITEFLQLCIFPRCLLSEIDALYCAHFIRVIHDLVTPNFSTIICYDRLFSDISYSLASCSENEAIRYGRFLESLLETVMSWHGDKNKFDKECATHPGFLTVFRNAGNAATKTTGTTQTPEQLDYDNFRHVCHKWHYKLAKSFIVCLDSNDYIQIRNVLQVLTVLLPIYPKMTTFYAALERRIKAICAAEKDRRHDLFALAKCYSGRLAHKHRDMIEESQFHSVPERQTSSSSTSNQNNNNNNQNNNNNNNAGTKMNPIVTPTIIGDTNNVNHHPILSDIQSTSSPTTRSIQKDSLTSNTTARPTSEKSMNVSTTSNGSTTATKSSSPAPSSQPTAPTSRSATITNITERSTSKTKTEPVIINSSSNSSSTTATISSTKSNRIPHGPSLPSSKTTVTSTTQNKIESNETSTSMTGRTIKLSNNPTDRHESPQASTISTLRESPPTNKKDTSTTIDRRPTSSTTEQQISSSKTSSAPVSRPTSSRTVTSTTRSSTSSVATTNDDSIRRSDQTATNGINSSTSSKTLRTESPHEHVPVEKKSRSGSSKGDRITTSHVDESRNSSSRSTHREHKHESNKRARSSTPEKRSANGGNSGSSSRRLNQTAESTLSTTPVHQDNEHSSGSGIMDVSPSSLSSKRIKTSDTISNGRSTRKEAREERHTSSSSSHRVSSSSRSDRRDKYHTSKETK